MLCSSKYLVYYYITLMKRVFSKWFFTVSKRTKSENCWTITLQLHNWLNPFLINFLQGSFSHVLSYQIDIKLKLFTETYLAWQWHLGIFGETHLQLSPPKVLPQLIHTWAMINHTLLQVDGWEETKRVVELRLRIQSKINSS